MEDDPKFHQSRGSKEDFSSLSERLQVSAKGMRTITVGLLKLNAEFIKAPPRYGIVRDAYGKIVPGTWASVGNTWRYYFEKTFDVIADVFLSEGKLSDEILRNEIPKAVSDAAVLGGWLRVYRGALSQHPTMPIKYGTFWIAERHVRLTNELCEALIVEWTAKLLERQLVVEEGESTLDTSSSKTRRAAFYESRIKPTVGSHRHWAELFKECTGKQITTKAISDWLRGETKKLQQDTRKGLAAAAGVAEDEFPD